MAEPGFRFERGGRIWSLYRKFFKKKYQLLIKESLERFSEVLIQARKKKIRVRGYLSTVFGCPYEGSVSSFKVLKLVEKYLELGVHEISLGDT